jgi:hypothetical protein
MKTIRASMLLRERGEVYGKAKSLPFREGFNAE